jgi:hypothetical protein
LHQVWFSLEMLGCWPAHPGTWAEAQHGGGGVPYTCLSLQQKEVFACFLPECWLGKEVVYNLVIFFFFFLLSVGPSFTWIPQKIVYPRLFPCRSWM